MMQLIIKFSQKKVLKKYKCGCRGKLVHEEIPNNLKKEAKHGSTTKILSLTLSNVGNVPYNKIRRILNGLSMGRH